MPVYPKGKKRGVWRVILSVRGRQREWIVRGTKAEAEAYEARRRVELAEGELPEVRVAPSFSDFCVTHYRPHAELHLRATTWKVRCYQLANLCEELGDVKLSAFTTGHVERYKRERLAAGAGPRTVNNELAVLQAVITYAKAVPVPVARFALQQLPVRGRGRVTVWSEAQVGALYRALEETAPEILPLVVFLANTGCRKGEAIAAEKSWIDRRARMLRIPVNEYWQPKDNEPREVPIADVLLPWIDRALAGPGRWLFPSSTGDRYACWPKRQFDRARRAASLRGGPHTLRHTFASHFLQSVPDMFLLSQVLGHSEARTSRLYAHLLPDHLARARNAVALVPKVGAAAAAARSKWR